MTPPLEDKGLKAGRKSRLVGFYAAKYDYTIRVNSVHWVLISLAERMLLELEFILNLVGQPKNPDMGSDAK